LARVGNRSGSPLFASRRQTGGEREKVAWRGVRSAANEQPPGPASAWRRDERTARLEAVLFLAREPINTRKLAQFAGLADGTEARTLIRRLNRWYDESGSAFRAEELAGGFQLMSRPKFGPWLRRMVHSPLEMRLSGPAQETLAVVAYRQPVLRAEIEAIRGVDCGEILRQLMDRDLVRTAGRANELGRPYRYATTKRFLQVFGLRHLDELPRADLLRTTGAAADPPAKTDEN
jgi:segregation and condensation protein B